MLVTYFVSFTQKTFTRTEQLYMFWAMTEAEGEDGIP